MSATLIWFRQDLRLEDNPALDYALKQGRPIVPVYIWETNAKTQYLPGAAQRWWLHHSLKALENSLNDDLGLRLLLLEGKTEEILEKLVSAYQVEEIVWNRCYEPWRVEHDKKLKQFWRQRGLHVESFNSALLLEPWEILNQQHQPFKVYTPFWKTCLKQYQPRVLLSKPVSKRLLPLPHPNLDSSLKFQYLKTETWLPTQPNWASDFSTHWEPGEKGAHKRLKHFVKNHLATYAERRDFLDTSTTSLLSPHLHWGEISPRAIWKAILEYQQAHRLSFQCVEKFLAQLGWREFSYHLLFHFPDLPEKNWRAEFDHFPWKRNAKHLMAWKKGKTGYPIVDAGMRELWKTGYMHNRARLIVASFLVKDLFTDWREGARWFWDTLLDADLANNSASWQWVAGSGADAAPYFRIFNPVLQGKKFDPEGKYIRRWVPELEKLPTPALHDPWECSRQVSNYPDPIVDHDQSRLLALKKYQSLPKSSKKQS